MTSLQDIARIALVGIGATAVMDVWLAVLRHLGVPTLNFAFIGRWVGHLLRGTVAHPAIARAAPIPGELLWGWLTHYAVGIAFAAVLAAVQGLAWLAHPTPLPAIALGVVTVLVPLGVMQPAMGAGLASRRTPTPWKSSLRSVANHAVFGLGLYLAAVVVAHGSSMA